MPGGKAAWNRGAWQTFASPRWATPPSRSLERLREYLNTSPNRVRHKRRDLHPSNALNPTGAACAADGSCDPPGKAPSFRLTPLFILSTGEHRCARSRANTDILFFLISCHLIGGVVHVPDEYVHGAVIEKCLGRGWQMRSWDRLGDPDRASNRGSNSGICPPRGPGNQYRGRRLGRIHRCNATGSRHGGKYLASGRTFTRGLIPSRHTVPLDPVPIPACDTSHMQDGAWDEPRKVGWGRAAETHNLGHTVKLTHPLSELQCIVSRQM